MHDILITVIILTLLTVNPLEFSRGSEIFKLTPTAAAVRLLNATLFNRGLEYATEAWQILGLWSLVFGLIFLFSLLFDIKHK